LKFPKDISKTKVIKILKKIGFEIVREGNHIAMSKHNPDGSKTPLTMPNHRRKDLGTVAKEPPIPPVDVVSGGVVMGA
jgi:predicted RNA binding protein YcfA (HicA-like mRNA interferase family)